MNLELKRIDIWSCIKISFILYGIFGLAIGIFYAILLTFLGGVLSSFGGKDFGSFGGLFTGFLGVFVAFFLAIFYAVIGTIFTALFAWLYNVFAKIAGGIKFEFEGEKVMSKGEESQASFKYE
jgi:uncharacterized protein YacL